MLYQEPIRWKQHYRTVRNAIFIRGPSQYQMQSYYYMNSYYKDKTVWRQSYRYNGMFTPGKAVLILRRGIGKFHVLLVGITGIPSLIARSMGPIWGRQGLSGPHVSHWFQSWNTTFTWTKLWNITLIDPLYYALSRNNKIPLKLKVCNDFPVNRNSVENQGLSLHSGGNKHIFYHSIQPYYHIIDISGLAIMICDNVLNNKLSKNDWQIDEFQYK